MIVFLIFISTQVVFFFFSFYINLVVNMSDQSSVFISPAILNISKYPTPPYTSTAAAPWPSPLSISSLSISSTSSIDMTKTTMFTFTPAVSADTTRYLNNILLILFQHHPTGV
eukprot:15328_1